MGMTGKSPPGRLVGRLWTKKPNYSGFYFRLAQTAVAAPLGTSLKFPVSAHFVSDSARWFAQP